MKKVMLILAMFIVPVLMLLMAGNVRASDPNNFPLDFTVGSIVTPKPAYADECSAVGIDVNIKTLHFFRQEYKGNCGDYADFRIVLDDIEKTFTTEEFFELLGFKTNSNKEKGTER